VSEAGTMPPLFILAPPRSFTSVICAMLGQHPQLLGLPEVNLFAADDYDGLERELYQMRPGFRHGLLRAIAQIGLGKQSVQNVDAAMSWLADNHALSGAAIFKDIATWAAPRRLVDKSPIYVYSDASLKRIEAAFPQACYLHLTRHPVSMCESVFKLRDRVQGVLGRLRGAGVDIERHVPADQLADVDNPDSIWLQPHRRILGFLDHIPPARWRRVRGEDFLASPDEHLVTLCQWLQIDQGSEAIEAMKHPERSPFAVYGPPNARFGNDPNFLENPALRPYAQKSITLDSPIDGAGDLVLSEAVKDCARGFGYA
jgi:hypothetical protein